MENQETLKLCQYKQSKFKEYLRLVEKDLHDRDELGKVSDQLDQLLKSLDTLEAERLALSEEVDTKRELRSKAHNDVTNYTEKYSNYALFDHGELINAPSEQLEIEYRNLRQKANLMLAEKEDLCKQLSKDIEENQQALKRYQNLSKSDYAIEYDPIKLEELKERYYNIKGECDRLSNKESLEMENIQRYQNELNRRLDVLSRYSLSEPLNRNEIHRDYNQRLKSCEETLRQAKQSEELSKKQIEDCKERTNRIEHIIDVDDIDNIENINEVTETVDITQEIEAFKSILPKLETAKDTLMASIRKARAFQTCDHPSLVSIIANMDSISIHNLENYYESFRTYENLTDNQKHLNDIIQYLTFELQVVESNRNNMVQQSYVYTKKLYEQVMWLPGHSYVTLHDKKVKVKTLDFDVPTELDTQAKERIENFVDSTIDKVRKASREDDFDAQKLENLVNDTFSDRTLFNVLTGKDTIKVMLYKFQQDSKNSRLESWESAYSGGERFMTYFVLYSALTAYTRSRSTAQAQDKTRSVFLIDNPFGSYIVTTPT